MLHKIDIQQAYRKSWNCMEAWGIIRSTRYLEAIKQHVRHVKKMVGITYSMSFRSIRSKLDQVGTKYRNCRYEQYFHKNTVMYMIQHI